MDCNEAQELMHAYMDGELDPPSALRFEKHHASCAACSEAYGKLRALHEAIKADAPVYDAPARLRQKIRAQLQENRPPVRKTPRWSWTWVNFGLATACSTVLAVLITLHVAAPAESDRLEQEVIAEHNRSLLADHLADVASSDRHTVKPWFTGKLDFSPPVYDLMQEGFPLIGGRLDYLNHRRVAALVYKHRQHVVNLFIWPDDGHSDASAKASTKQGFQMRRWNQAGMDYWMISDMDAESMATLENLLRSRIDTKSQS
jgi:mycothiol system anti-sigma-R factor